jgi:hypothetical protein
VAASAKTKAAAGVPALRNENETTRRLARSIRLTRGPFRRSRKLLVTSLLTHPSPTRRQRRRASTRL